MNLIKRKFQQPYFEDINRLKYICTFHTVWELVLNKYISYFELLVVLVNLICLVLIILTGVIRGLFLKPYILTLHTADTYAYVRGVHADI